MVSNSVKLFERLQQNIRPQHCIPATSPRGMSMSHSETMPDPHHRRSSLPSSHLYSVSAGSFIIFTAAHVAAVPVLPTWLPS